MIQVSMGWSLSNSRLILLSLKELVGGTCSGEMISIFRVSTRQTQHSCSQMLTLLHRVPKPSILQSRSIHQKHHMHPSYHSTVSSSHQWKCSCRNEQNDRSSEFIGISMLH